jgi:hypothetical protein
MSIRDVPRPDWVSFLDRFSREHRGWLTTVEQSGTGESTRPIRAIERPLGSLDAALGEGGVRSITIHFAEEADAGAAVRIDAPVALRVAENARGAERGLEIATATGATRLQFRATALPEELDGMAPTEL